MKKLMYLFKICFAIVLSSCEKEGPIGMAGKDGNANVTSSTVSVTFPAPVSTHTTVAIA